MKLTIELTADEAETLARVAASDGLSVEDFVTGAVRQVIANQGAIDAETVSYEAPA